VRSVAREYRGLRSGSITELSMYMYEQKARSDEE
jgi:hypothetical protein